MPDLLLFSKDIKASAKIEELVLQASWRIKSCQEISSFKKWLDSRDFDYILISEQASEVELDQIFEMVGGMNSLCPYAYIYSTNISQEKKYRSLIAGAEVITSSDLVARLDSVVKQLKKSAGKKLELFNIMVVEDLDAVRDIVCAYIESFGFPLVRGVTCAKEALEALEAEPGKYSCLVTDLRMPNMGGEELIQILRRDERFAHLPIIVLTAHADAETLYNSLKAGASGFLAKPPRRQDISRELARAYRIYTNRLSPRLFRSEELYLAKKMLLGE